MREKLIQLIKSFPGRAVIVTFLLGLLFGWLIIGWWIWPVTWTDAGFVDLQSGYAELAMRNAINAYNGGGEERTAIESFLAFNGIAEETYQAVKESGVVQPEALKKFDSLLAAQGVLPSGETVVSEAPAQEEEIAQPVVDEAAAPLDAEVKEEAPDNKALNRIGLFIGILFVLLLAVGLYLAYKFLIPDETKDFIKSFFVKNERKRDLSVGAEGGETPTYLSSMGSNEDYSYEMDRANASFEDIAPSSSPPSVNSLTSPRRSPIERSVNYVHNDTGRSHLEQNFSLKDTDDSGKTVLEYGIAMSDAAVVEGVTYALAFDIYLISHPEQRTVTRVLVNKDLLNHPEVLQRYEGKGEPIKIDEFQPFQLDTGKYRLNGMITAVEYVYDAKYGGNYIREMEVDLLIHYL